MNHPVVIDSAKAVTTVAEKLFEGGVRVVIRYYTSDPKSWKIIKRPEADAIGAAGLGLAAVYQVAQNKPENFDPAQGDEAGRIARAYARETIAQPPGSAIYFAVDYDASTSDLANGIGPYFEAARKRLREGGVGRGYRIGVYGSGLVCSSLLDAGIADLAWVAGASAWRGTKDFLASNRWAIHQRRKIELEGISVDPDDVQENCVDFGQFHPAGPPGPPLRSIGTYRVSAGALNVRAAPGVQAERLGTLRRGDEVDVIGFAGEDHGWAALGSTDASEPQRYTSARYLDEV